MAVDLFTDDQVFARQNRYLSVLSLLGGQRICEKEREDIPEEVLFHAMPAYCFLLMELSGQNQPRWHTISGQLLFYLHREGHGLRH